MTTKWKNTGAVLKEFRESKGLTLEYVSEQMQVSRQYLSMAENGYTASTKALCGYIKLGINIEALINAYEKDMGGGM